MPRRRLDLLLRGERARATDDRGPPLRLRPLSHRSRGPAVTGRCDTCGSYHTPLPRVTGAVPTPDPGALRAPILSTDAYRAWRGERRLRDMAAHIAATGLAPIRVTGSVFYWTCPGCGGTAVGDLADQPVSGWDAPRWVRSGPDDAATLTPSLGCPRWRDGACIGHWWLRDGRLVLA